jgi:Ca2+-binding EF-hand superfamily protein
MRFMNVGERSVMLLAVVAIFAWAGSVSAAPKSARGSSTTKPAPKLCLGAVDPFDRSTQKAGFFAIAGKDGELTNEEFQDAADKTSTKTFLRSFDTFAALSRFDKDKNSKIDWVEAQAYRIDLRKRVMAAFDANKDSRLRGPEREAANRALASGRFARGGGPAGGGRVDFMQRYDTDGDGKLSDAERNAMREEFRKGELERYDKDGDGKISEEERQAMRRGRGGMWAAATERWRLQHFDVDGDGKLSEAEEAEQKEFQGQFRAMGKALDVRFNDLDGDGEVSAEERHKIRQEWQKSALQMIAMASTYMDRDGDGEVSQEEREGFGKRVQTGMIKWMEDFGKEFDADTSGRLDKAERGAFLVGLRKSIETRVKRFDADQDGRLTPPETIELIKDFAKEIDIVPSKPKDPDKAGGEKTAPKPRGRR